MAWVKSAMGLMRLWCKAGMGCASLDLPKGEQEAELVAGSRVTMMAPLRGGEEGQEAMAQVSRGRGEGAAARQQQQHSTQQSPCSSGPDTFAPLV